jgi:hypothetical protein
METLIISHDGDRGDAHAETVVVRTPLDAIARLEHPRPIDAVVLAGSFAVNDELATFLAESYPSVRLLRERR